MSQPRSYPRFSLASRVEHWVQVLSFTTLALTGLVQKYAEASLSQGIVGLLGGIENTRLIHHTAAIVLMLEVVYHIGSLGYRIFVRRVRFSMLPGIADLRHGVQALLYNLGLRATKPQQGRFTFEEKAEYWALMWGTVVMVITGFMMWNPIATTRFLPGEIVPAAKAAHGSEALLAVLAIIVWHMYHVHLRQFNRSMFSGHLSEEEMLDEHPLELADIKAGIDGRPVDAGVLARRRRMFLPVYGVLAAALLAGIAFFVSFEQTAIATVPGPPPESVVVFAPLTPTPLPTRLPTATPAPVTSATWEGRFAELLAGRCGQCHGAAATAGLNLSTYEGVLAGGASGPAVVSGDPDASMLVMVQGAGSHPGQLTIEELNQVIEWIQAGAPEK